MATVRKTRSGSNQTAEILSQYTDLLREIIQTARQELLEAEMDEAIGAKREREPSSGWHIGQQQSR